MKITFVFFTALLSSFTVLSQNTGHFYGSEDGTLSNDLKLGKRNSTSTTPHFFMKSEDGGSAQFILHSVRWGGGYTWSRESDGGIDRNIAYLYGSGSGSYFQLFNHSQVAKVSFNTNGTSFINGGKVGIGTDAPAEEFHISGSGLVKSLVESSDNHAYYVVEGAPNKGAFVDYHRKGDGRVWHTGLRNANNNFEFRLNNQSSVLTLKQNGSVGIGTNSTFGYKLAVNGTIGSKEVNVENTSAWPDFVFDRDYDLRSLEEVEQHIAEKGHLPEIPSEVEVTENGINLGEMNAKLLQKIEELTLYLIHVNKQNQAQQAEIDELKKMNIELLKKLENK